MTIMAEEQPSGLHIDTDWKKQAQEEKRRLAEEEQKRAAERERAGGAASAPGAGAGIGMGAAPTTGAPASTGAAARGRAGSPGASARERAMPDASFGTLVNSLMTQVLLYLGELAPRGVEPQVNLDMAKFNIDLLGVLEEKTRNNLTPDEQKLLDTALYETRMRYVQIASQYATV
jgi:hypothetical protein